MPYQAAGAQQKTMVAGMAPPMMPGGGYAGGPPPPMGMGGPPPPMGGPPPPMGMGNPGGMPMGNFAGAGQAVSASPMQKTMMANIGPGFNPSAMKPGQQEQMTNNKTVMLQPSEGVVSIARGGQVAAGGGASTLFWIVSLTIGVAVGVLGYVIVLQM
jgi:hypothetical protein